MTHSLVAMNTRNAEQYTPSLFDDLPDDVLTNILWHCNFSAAVALAGACRNLRRRLIPDENDSGACVMASMIWRTIYERHGFCPPETSVTSLQSEGQKAKFYQGLCRDKRQLLRNLIGGRNQEKRCRSTPFNLPNRHFYFLPIVPIRNEDDGDYPSVWDPPPVVWECDSFVLTGSGSSSELLLLDPFDGSLRVVNCLQYNTVASDEAMMELALMNAAKALILRGQQQHQDDDEAHVAGAAIEDMIQINHSRHEQRPPLVQCLLPGDESFDLDVTDYFPHLSVERLEREEFEINYVGTEAKSIWKLVGGVLQCEGTMVGLGRCVTSVDHERLQCTEMTTWTRLSTQKVYHNRRRCRLPWAFYSVDLDGCHQRIFCSFAPDDGPDGSSSVISVYPLVDENECCFPPRLLSIPCQYPTCTFAVDAMGQTLLIATLQGTLEFWTVSEHEAICQDRFALSHKLRSSVKRELTRRIQAVEGQKRVQARGHRDDTIATNNVDDDDDDDNNILTSGCVALRRLPDLPQFCTPIQSFFVPKHLPVEQLGFVTLHYSRDEGSSLLVWKWEDNQWEIVSLIHLRLSVRRRPRVQFDGNRIIVFGEDHIGPIILVYQVRGAETSRDFVDLSSANAGEASGGVYHFSAQPHVKFANRIRHVALGGIEAMDSIHLTCNERFLIVNTLTGNHLGSSPYSHGLMVIDLQDQQ